jgi:hypothetical protein
MIPTSPPSKSKGKGKGKGKGKAPSTPKAAKEASGDDHVSEVHGDGTKTNPAYVSYHFSSSSASSSSSSPSKSSQKQQSTCAVL